MTAHLQLVDEGNCQVIGTRPPLVAPGTYDLMYIYDETLLFARGRAPKLALWFRVLTPGPFTGAKLPRYYNVTKIEGKPRRGGGFKVGWGSDFIRDFASLFNSVPGRTNRIPMSRFEGVAVRGIVKTVVSNWNQGNLPQPLHYSTIEKLLSLVPEVSPSPAPVPTPTGNREEKA